MEVTFLQRTVSTAFAKVFFQNVRKPEQSGSIPPEEADSWSLGSLLSATAVEPEELESDGVHADDLKIRVPFIATNANEVFLVTSSTSHFWKGFDGNCGQKQQTIAHSELPNRYTKFFKLKLPEIENDFTFKPFGYWLSSTLARYKKFYRDVILASVVINIVALMIPLFSMNVYDKVVPNTAFQTLWVLASVIFIGLCYDWLLKVARAKITDRVGQEVDEELSMKLMERVLRSRAEQKPNSVGSFSKSFQDFDSVRDFMMSATSTTLVDLPFGLLFLLVIGAIGGWIVLVPIVAMLLMLGLAIYSQRKMKGLIEAQFEVRAKRSGRVFEALQMADLLKTSNAIPWMLQKWRNDIEGCADVGFKTSSFSTKITSTTQLLMQMVSICTVIVGVYLIAGGNLTMGGLIASMMLSTKAVQSVLAFSTILTRYQQARAGIDSVDQLLSMEPERRPEQTIVERKHLQGAVKFEEVSFVYPGAQQAALKDINIVIEAGEKVALIGNMGSGKSTLLSMLSGLYLPSEGRLLFDNLDVSHWDTDMLRSHIGTVTQAPALIKGSLYENITLGLTKHDQNQVIEAIKACGLDSTISRFEGGLDYQIGEGNRGVSGGQAQTISLARAIVKNASLLIFDEPTSMLDKEAEARFLKYLSDLDKSTTVIVSSHSPAILQIFDRAIVLDKGKVRFNGPTYKLFQTGQKTQKSDNGGTSHVN